MKAGCSTQLLDKDYMPGRDIADAKGHVVVLKTLQALAAQKAEASM